MKKILVIVLSVILLISTNLSAYVSAAIVCPTGCNYLIFDSSYPAYKTYHYYKAPSCPSTALSAIDLAMSAWNIASGNTMTLTLSGNTTTKIFDMYDTYNSIGTMMSQADLMALGASNAIAVNATTPQSNSIRNSDIALNSSFSYGNGQSTAYYDYRGIFTHELGHTWGLKDLYDGYPQLSMSSISDVPTMYGSAYTPFSSVLNVFPFMQSLTQGDINGIKAMKQFLGW